MFSIRTYYQTSEPDVVITTGLYSRTARRHTITSFLQRENIMFIEPSNSPDMNPVDYAVWEALH